MTLLGQDWTMMPLTKWLRTLYARVWLQIQWFTWRQTGTTSIKHRCIIYSFEKPSSARSSTATCPPSMRPGRTSLIFLLRLCGKHVCTARTNRSFAACKNCLAPTFTTTVCHEAEKKRSLLNNFVCIQPTTLFFARMIESTCPVFACSSLST